MNVSYFISQRLRHKGAHNFSAVIEKIAVGSIALGLASMIISFLIFKGFKGEIQEKVFSFGAHIKAEKFDLNNSFEQSPISTNSYLFQHYDEIEGINHIQSFSQKPALIKVENEVASAVFKGVSLGYDSLRFKKYLLEGRFIDFSAKKYAKEIIISKQISNKLQIKVSDEVILFFVQDPPRIRKLKVVGIYQTWIEEFDNLLVIGDERLVRRLNNWDDTLSGGFEIFVDDFDQLNPTFERVYNKMDYDFSIDKVTDSFAGLFDWFIMLNRNVYVFLLIILTVASFNIVAIMLIIIMERTNMIGSLKALGASNKQIQQIFIFTGYRLIVKGLLIGNAIGIGFGFVQQKWKVIPLEAQNYFMDSVPISFDWLIILGLNILFILLIAAVLFFPTLLISRIEPVKSIKFN